jgi:hypothetical protein
MTTVIKPTNEERPKTQVLTDALEQLAEYRGVYDRAKAQHDAALDAWKNANKDMIDRMEQAKADVAEVDEAVREFALEIYGETMETKPADGVEIKQVDTAIIEVSAATDWARANMPALLTLNNRAYEKVLREVQASKLLSGLMDMPGVVRTEPKVYVARDLSAYLESRDDRSD